MNELETRMKELKKELKPFDILSIICVAIVLISAAFIITGFCIRKSYPTISDAIFWSGIGAFSAGAIVALSIVFIKSKQYNEYYRLCRELRKSKK